MDIDKLTLKFLWRGKRPRLANTILENRVRGQMTLNFKSYCKTTNQDSVALAKEQTNRSMDRIENPEIDTYKDNCSLTKEQRQNNGVKIIF